MKRVLLAVFLLLAVRVSAQDSSLAGLQIVYNMFYNIETDNYEIFVMNPDGSGRTNISNWEGVDWAYYAKGDKLYFVSDRDSTHRKFFLYEMNADGSNVRKVSQFLVRDSWTSSRKAGTEFVVASSKSGNAEIYLIDKDGKELKQLTNNTFYDNDPCFSPDGSQIVFCSKRDGGLDELWIMNADGSNQRQLTHFPKDDTMKVAGYHAGPPSWEPNRNVISFISMRQGKHHIFTIKPDGTGLTQIKIDGTNEQGWHSWSPDGRWLTFDGSDSIMNYDIYLLDTKTNKVKQLTEEPTFEQCPVFVKKVKK
jgi:TolB protein